MKQMVAQKPVRTKKKLGHYLIGVNIADDFTGIENLEFGRIVILAVRIRPDSGCFETWISGIWPDIAFFYREKKSSEKIKSKL